MDLDFLEDHKEKIFWYVLIFGGGFAFGFLVAIVVYLNPLNSAIQNGLVWGSSGVFFTFLVILAGKHLK